jgi:FkbM family methyltransferase
MRIKRFIGRLMGVDIYGLGARAIRIIPRNKRPEAWFSYESILSWIIQEYNIDLVIDVGANIGDFTDNLRSYYKGPVISFEPVRGLYNTLEKVASRDKNWYVMHYALANESKEQEITVFENSKLSSLLNLNENLTELFKGSVVRTRERIQVRRLDDILDELPLKVTGRNIFLKLDTQGYDLEAFRGSSKIMDNIVALQSELFHQPIYDYAPHWLESLNEYEKTGFNLVGLYPIIKDGLCYAESDCLMIKTR